jgi:hypothetical protein
MKLSINDIKIDVPDTNDIHISSQGNKIFITVSTTHDNDHNSDSEEVFSNGLTNAVAKFMRRHYIKTSNHYDLVDLSTLSLQFFVSNAQYSKHNDKDFKGAMELLGYTAVDKYNITYFQGIIPRNPPKY